MKVTQSIDFPYRQNSQLRKVKLQNWILPSLISAFLLASPQAQAAQLETWRFESDLNQLSFTTEGGVQPTAQLLSNPTRLVIDLPGTTLGGQSMTQAVGGTIQEIRVGQLNDQTSRIVVELAAGYILDAQQVQFEGISPNQWTVKIPDPEVLGTPIPQGSADRPESSSPLAATGGNSLLQSVEIQDEGFIFHTDGATPTVDLKQGVNGTWVSVDLPGVTIAPDLEREFRNLDRLGVNQLQLLQTSNSPPSTRAILTLTETDRTWQARVSDRGQVLVWPEGENAPEITAQQSSGLATIQGIELIDNQVVVKADRTLNYNTEWDQKTLAYRLTLYSSHLGNGVTRLQPERGSSVLWVRPTQEDPETVVVLVQPAAGIRVSGVEQQSGDRLSIQLQTSDLPTSDPNVQAIAVNSPDSSPSTSPGIYPESEIPPIPAGRIAVVIDPGHGGVDPGAVGIGGLQEKDVVMDISEQVATILEQNGITAIMTRQDDRTIDLAPRVQLANRVNANLFVSIHANAVNGKRPEVNGVETYYYASGRNLAQFIQRSILQDFSMRDRGVKQARFYVLRHTSMPAVLVEVGFVTGNEDARILSDAAQRTRMAESIARGILDYVRRNP
jgi:N-acetylmuramoyl-L-alanine amidase